MPGERRRHIDEEACCARLHAAALGGPDQCVGDVGELDQIALGQGGAGGDHFDAAQQELTRRKDLVGGSQRGQQYLRIP
ncbi:hypothetical protein [Streptomyces silvensis]|uniref:Uncharacterized protein n=1 Tax=Streptomyces silvensis TaxID=1765722 RepID=A0A0W7X8U4_9ACTN|nr:hypothetical protein [Streptomyces silvensis]KUF19401.1 hypothetical protein AT728_30850 [Streptomyces silvensis]